jgi:uncharacterized membrane protein YgcG
VSNVFETGASKETLGAVSFYATSNETSYEIMVYSNPVNALDPTSGTPEGIVQSGTVPLAGYHTVKLDNKPALPPGTVFAVVIKLTTPGFYYPIPIETQIRGYSSKAVIEPGVSFISLDGSSWQDAAATQNVRGNVCLRAFTKTSDSQGSQENDDPLGGQGSSGGQSAGSGGGGCQSGGARFLIASIICLFVMRARKSEADGR